MIRITPQLFAAGLLVILVAHSIYAIEEIRDLREERDQVLRQVQARDNAIQLYADQRAADEAATQARQSALEQEIADYETTLAAANRECRLDSRDLDWLRP